MDMGDPYIKAVKHYCRTTKIVFDLFHVKKEFGRVITTVRHRAYLSARGEDREVLRGSKFLLLSNRTRLSRSEVMQLEHLLSLNKELATLYMLKDQLNVIWTQTSTAECSKALYSWIAMALQSGIREAIAFTKRLMRYEYGIISHALFPIHTGKLEGINNTIKVLKRRCYGFRDSAYFALKIKQAFPGNMLN